MSENVKENLKQKSTWKRGLFMLIFAVLLSVAKVVLFAVAILQFLLVLFTNDTNPRLLKLGQGLATYSYQIIQYLSFNSDYQAYPFGAWPKGEPTELKKQLDKKDAQES